MPAEALLQPEDSLLRIDAGLAIPRSELEYRATRSGGPGGQHVNTSSTRIELTWNILASAALSEGQRARLLQQLATRVDSAGTLRIVSAVHRSQNQNRLAADERLVAAVRNALRERRPRKATSVPKAQKEARLKTKKHRGRIKKLRGRAEQE